MQSPDLAANAVDSGKVADHSLLGEDLAAGQVPGGPAEPAGHKGSLAPRATRACPSAPACVGPPGPAAVSEYAQFYALMPNDNPATVAAGSAVSFPNDGPQKTPGAPARVSASAFQLSDPGTIWVSFIVSVNEAGQLLLQLDDADVAYTVVGRATGTSQIVGESLVTTTQQNEILEVVNPSGNSTALHHHAVGRRHRGPLPLRLSSSSWTTDRRSKARKPMRASGCVGAPGCLMRAGSSKWVATP